MINIKKLFLLLLFCIFNPFNTFSQDIQTVRIEIGNFSTIEKIEHFDTAEELREKFNFWDAIEEYQKVLSGDDLCGKESEAMYNIGLCFTWLQDFKRASEYFNTIYLSYPDDHKATAYAEYGLAWIDVKEGNYSLAIKRLKQKLDEKKCPDEEHNAVMQFQIGRINLVYLKNHEKAKSAFRKVLENHPNSNISKHPYVENIDNPSQKMFF